MLLVEMGKVVSKVGFRRINNNVNMGCTEMEILLDILSRDMK